MNSYSWTVQPNAKIENDYSKLAKKVEALKALDMRIVCTIGSWDNLHIGHLRYLYEALTKGDVLVVGVDSDRGMKAYKGPLRPIIPQEERCEMLTYQLPVSFVTVVDDIDGQGNWGYGLIEHIRPDVFVAVEDSYPPTQIQDIEKYCTQVAVLPRQAETSTSKTIHDAVKNAMLLSTPQIAKELAEELTSLVEKSITADRISSILERIEHTSRTQEEDGASA